MTILVLVALVATACSGESGGAVSIADRVVAGIPEGWTGPDPGPLDSAPLVGWVGDEEFGVITIGSGSCPPVADELRVVSPSTVEISFAESPHDVCTADMAPTTHVFGLPESVVERPVEIVVALPNGDPTSLRLP